MKRTVVYLALALLVAACISCRQAATEAAPSLAPVEREPPQPTATYTPAPTPTATPKATQERGPAVEQIGPAGGVVLGPDGARLIVPEGALSGPTTFRFTRAQSTPALLPDSAVEPAGLAYELSPLQDTEVLAPLELVLPLQRQTDVDESRYTVLRWDGDVWSDLGGAVEGDAIHVQLTGFSLFQPALGAQSRRPVKFLNGGPNDARVSAAWYKPASGDPGALVPRGGWTCRAPGPPLAVDRRVCRWLPLGAYAFTIEFKMAGQTYHYVLNWLEGVSETDPMNCALAQTVHFRTDVINPTPGPGGAVQLILSPPPGARATATRPDATRGLSTTTPTPVGPTVTPKPGRIQTEGEGLIVTVKPGHPGSLSADGKSQTVLLVDVDPNAACWGGPDVLDGIYIMAETTLGEVTWPGRVPAGELPAEIVLTAGTTRGQAVVTITGAYCPPPEVIAFGVCTDPTVEHRRCVARAVVSVD